MNLKFSIVSEHTIIQKTRKKLFTTFTICGLQWKLSLHLNAHTWFLLMDGNNFVCRRFFCVRVRVWGRESTYSYVLANCVRFTRCKLNRILGILESYISSCRQKPCTFILKILYNVRQGEILRSTEWFACIYSSSSFDAFSFVF